MSDIITPRKKEIVLDGRFEKTNEPRVRIVDRNHTHQYKYASRKTKDLIHDVKPENNIVKALVLAMSATEYYGPNRNGDGFAETKKKIGDDWAVKPDETLPKWHCTFEDSAHVFRHHVNKDPQKSLGPVYDSIYNWNMHRVELLVGIDLNAGSRIAERIRGEEYPPVSMGCRIDYDVCNICGNRAPRMRDYCKHVSGDHPDYGMNELLDDGRRCFVWNPAPKFFDLSYVFEPADEIGRTMKLVAEPKDCEKTASQKKEDTNIYPVSGRTKEANRKRADLNKVSEMDKYIRGHIGSVDESKLPGRCAEPTKHVKENVIPPLLDKAESLPSRIISDMAEKGLDKMFASTNAAGIIPTPGEIFRVICHKKGIQPPDKAVRVVNVSTGPLSDLVGENPEELTHVEEYLESCMKDENVDSDLVYKLGNFREKRGLYEDYLMREHVPEEVGVPFSEATGVSSPDDAYYGSTQDTLHVRDPSSGQTYETTQRAAEKADWSNNKKLMAEGIGTAAALGLGYKTLTSGSKRLKWLTPALLGGSIYGAKNLMEGQSVPDIQTREGVKVPANTEFVPKTASKEKISTDLLLPVITSQDYITTDPDSYDFDRAKKAAKSTREKLNSDKSDISTKKILSEWGKEVVKRV